MKNLDGKDVSLLGVFVYPLADYFFSELSPFKSYKVPQKFDAVEAGELHTMLDGRALILIILGSSKKEVINLRNKIINIWHIKFEAPKQQIEGIRKI